jgi:hypothetical protein
MKWLGALPLKCRRGSSSRCSLFMEGYRTSVAAKLTTLVALPDVHVDARDFWMPRGLPVLKRSGEWDTSPVREARLGESKGFLREDQQNEVTNWWLSVRRLSNTPNWDIASTCMIGGKAGLLLFEAKAHCAELKQEGKTLGKRPSDGSKDNHDHIGLAISEASAGLEDTMSGWKLSCDSHYQLANRFAWAWKLASIGIPVVLVYLGFLGAKEMSDLGEPFHDCADWSRVVLEYSRNIVPEGAWGAELRIGSIPIKPLIRVWQQDFPGWIENTY